MKTTLFVIPRLVYITSTALAISFVSILAIDIVNDNRSKTSVTFKQPDEIFPKFIKWITLEKISLDFAGVEFPNPK
jgi:hypothetical protein